MFAVVVLMTAPLILLAASLLASYIPARRAMKVDPDGGPALGVTPFAPRRLT